MMKIQPVKFCEAGGKEWVEVCEANDPGLSAYGLYGIDEHTGQAIHEDDITPAEMQQYMDYLYWLRGEGPVNMNGAGPYLAKEFGLCLDEANAILIYWIETFKEPEHA